MTAPSATGLGALTQEQMLSLATGGNTLIMGATGTGKTHLARMLHRQAERHVGPALLADALDNDWDGTRTLSLASRAVHRRTALHIVIDHVLVIQSILPVLRAATRAGVSVALTSPSGLEGGLEDELLELFPTVIVMDPLGVTSRTLDTRRPIGAMVKGLRQGYEPFLGRRRMDWPNGTGWMLALSGSGLLFGRVPWSVER